MPFIPAEQHSPYPKKPKPKPAARRADEAEADGKTLATDRQESTDDRPGDDGAAAPATLQRRQGDRGSADDAEARLRILVRFRDLKAAGYVSNWPTLLRLIDSDDFPPGFLLGRNIRVWRLEDVEAWIARRPTARKTVPPRRSANATEAA